MGTGREQGFRYTKGAGGRSEGAHCPWLPDSLGRNCGGLILHIRVVKSLCGLDNQGFLRTGCWNDSLPRILPLASKISRAA